MTRTFMPVGLVVAAATCWAGDVGPITKAPSYAPPYGAFEYSVLGMTPEQQKATRLAIVKHYGYSSLEEASKACAQALPRARLGDCAADPVAHKHDESPEIRKYGFASWWGAVEACLKEKRKHHDTLPYCTVDPFVRLRAENH